MLSEKKDQEIIVDSPLPRESIGQSSDSTPTLPYSHGQAVLLLLPLLLQLSLLLPLLYLFPKMLLLNIFLWFPPLQVLLTILHCNLLRYLSLTLPLILILFYLLQWVPLYMAALFLPFILKQPPYLVLTP